MNDAPGNLAEVGPGNGVATESAGVELALGATRWVTGVVRLSRVSYREMIQNHASGGGYNVVVIPLSAGVSAWAGLDLSPAVATILMSVSTIGVALNAQLLRRVVVQSD